MAGSSERCVARVNKGSLKEPKLVQCSAWAVDSNGLCTVHCKKRPFGLICDPCPDVALGGMHTKKPKRGKQAQEAEPEISEAQVAKNKDWWSAFKKKQVEDLEKPGHPEQDELDHQDDAKMDNGQIEVEKDKGHHDERHHEVALDLPEDKHTEDEEHLEDDHKEVAAEEEAPAVAAQRRVYTSSTERVRLHRASKKEAKEAEKHAKLLEKHGEAGLQTALEKLARNRDAVARCRAKAKAALHPAGHAAL